MMVTRAPRSIKDLEFLNKLGEGTFGIVHKAKNRHTGELVAVKEMQSNTTKAKTMFLHEAKVLRMVNHPHLLRLVAVFVQEEEDSSSPCVGDGEMCLLNQKLYLVTEFCTGGSLATILTNERIKQIPWRTRIRFAHETAMGLAHLHENDLVHRDLKAENIFLKLRPLVDTAEDSANVNSNSSSDSGTDFSSVGSRSRERNTFNDFSVVLADFGLARWREKRKNAKMTIRGTAWTMAPELMTGSSSKGGGGGYTPACDIFSLGCVLLEIAARTKPQEIPRANDLSIDLAVVNTMSTNPKKEKRKSISKGLLRRRDSIRDQCPPLYMSLVKECVCAAPSKRPSIQSVVMSLAELR